MSGVSLASPDISLGLDDQGVIREASLSSALPDEVVDSWVGRSWSDVVGEVGADSVQRMIEDARSSGVSPFRNVIQRFPSGRELSIEYTTFRSDDSSGGMIALGKNLQGVFELQSRLAAAQQATEREYWKLRDVETRYRLLFDASPEAVLMIGGEDLRIVEANPAAVRALGLAPGWEFPGNLSWAERETFALMLQRVREQGRTPGIVLHLGPDREPWAVRASLMGSKPGLRYLLHIAPAGPRPSQESSRGPTAIETLVNRLPDGFVALDGQGTILRVNEAFLGLIYAGSDGDVRGQPIGRWMSEPGADAAVLLDTIRRRETVRLFQTTLHGELGSKTKVELSACQYGHGDQQAIGMIVRDIGRRITDAAPVRDIHVSVVDAAVAQLGQVPLLQVVRTAADMVEWHMIKAALDRVGGNRTAAAELLGLSRQSLHTKLNRHADRAASVGDTLTGEYTLRVKPLPQERPHTPAFGEADLSNCEREQIHLAGSIQPHGVLLVLREPDYVVVQASSNAAEVLGIVGPVLGWPIADIPGNLTECISPHMDVPLLHTMPLAVRCMVGNAHGLFDVALHRPPQGGLVIELEPAALPVSRTRQAMDAVGRILAAFTLRNLCDESARIVQELTGYDRVMVYRFDEAGHGEVLSEARLAALEPFLGNRYPATDIPQIARRLYERNRVRVLVDIDYEPVPVLPAISPLTGQPLDMSLCLLRSISPIHIQYLKNMGVGATLVVSLMVGGRLWGLIACHHYVPRTVPFDLRVVCELLAETIATRIAALESSQRGQAELSVRRLEQRLTEAIQREGDWRGALFDSPQSLLQPLRATGAALLFDGQIMVAGEVPGTQDLRQIGAWLDGKRRNGVHATASLGLDEPTFAPLRAVASGVIAAALSAVPGEYLLWFRPEQLHTVTWGGDPTKAVVIGDTPQDLSPRRSFAQWHQLVERTSETWTGADLAAAQVIGDTIKDVILQFRSVSMLVAQQQLEKVRQQVGKSELPVVIAGADGRILLVNDALSAAIGHVQPAPQWLSDLPDLFADAGEFRRRLQDLCDRGLTWRGRVRLRSSARPLLIRADPVLSSPDQISGFVLLLTDLSQQETAEAARLSFQERVLERTRVAGNRIDPKGDTAMQNVLATVVENAQLAALEITDGVDVARMPEMLESVRASVVRARRAIDHLIWHANSVTQRLH